MSAKLGQNARLERIDKTVDWETLGKLVEGVYAAKGGRPSYPPLMMVKVLLLEQWCNLSDPQMEEALNDRMAFRRFVGLGFQGDAPDYSTISRFRTALGEELSAQLFRELERQLEEKGVVLKRGTLMDAMLVQAQVRRPPLNQGRGAKSPLDPDADWTGFHWGSRSHFGYKVHIGMDEGSGIVRTAVFTPAKVYESEVAEELVSMERWRSTETGPTSPSVEGEWLKPQGIKDRTMHRANKHQRVLPHWGTETQRVDISDTVQGGEGVRDVETELRLPAGEVPGSEAQRPGDVVQADGLQPEKGGQDSTRVGLKRQQCESAEMTPMRR